MKDLFGGAGWRHHLDPTSQNLAEPLLKQGFEAPGKVGENTL